MQLKKYPWADLSNELDEKHNIIKVFAKCTICSKLKPGMFPKGAPGSFYRKPSIVSRAARTDGTRSGEMWWENFANHVKHPGHTHAVESGNSSLWNRLCEKTTHGCQAWLISVFAFTSPRYRRMRPCSQAISGDLSLTILNRTSSWKSCSPRSTDLKNQNKAVLKNCFAQQLSLDDGTAADIREWLSPWVVLHRESWWISNIEFHVRFDSTSLGRNRCPGNAFCVGKARLTGTNCSGLVVTVLPSRRNFFNWSSNTNPHLLLMSGVASTWMLFWWKLSCLESPNFHLSLIKCPQYSLPENHKGANTPKRAEKLTRWTAVKTCSSAILVLLPHLLEVWMDELNDKVEIKHAETKELFSFQECVCFVADVSARQAFCEIPRGFGRAYNWLYCC